MNRFIKLIVTVCLFANTCFAGETGGRVLFPGFTFYRGQETLSGRLLFVVSQHLLHPTNHSDTGVICEVDLANGEFRELSRSPSVEYFVSSVNGDACAVLSLEKSLKPGEVMLAPFEYLPTMAFLYCRDLRQSKSIRLTSRPKDVAFVGRHFFFQLDVFDGEARFGSVPSRERIVHYDFDKGIQKYLELPNASRWENERFNGMYVDAAASNLLHFRYSHHGAQLREGRDYPIASLYVFDVENGVVKTEIDKDGDVGAFKCFDGQFVWFGGYDTPIMGSKLHKSKWKDERFQMLMEPSESSKKTLAKFSRFGGKVNKLLAISPCRHFAFIRSTTEASGGRSGNTYHIVDVTTGHSRVLLRDEVQLRANGSLSSVWWVK
ncbi:MAG: hypothetical protein KJ070_25415 [Verrucomicrobia bacterium]|nr:hypothetical protein [Verrucomicrobiota bacterium]